MPRTPLILLVSLVISICLLPATPRVGATQVPGTLTWRPCGGSLQCATLDVPVDYANPASRTISLALVRQPARLTSQRIGALVFNPGGPGASGVQFLRDWAAFLPADLANRFDLVSFDPRGIGESAPLECADNILELIALDPTPENEQERMATIDTLRTFGATCRQRSPDLLAHMGTRDVARDMEALRVAMGEEKLSYVGFSYGTVIGQVYADMFPANVRAMVLDGAFDLSLAGAEAGLQQSKAYEAALQQFIADCRARGCISPARGDTAVAIDQLFQTVEATPLPGGSRPAGISELVAALYQGLFTESQWPQLGSALNAATAGDGSGIVRLADLYYGRQPSGLFNNSFEAYAAVSCLDQPWPRDPAYYPSLQFRAGAEAPHFGPWNIQTWLPCAVWPVPAIPLTPPAARGAPPIMVIGTTGDPATPYAWAEAVARQLPGSVLVKNNDEGHTAYLEGDACIKDVVNRYLVVLTVPAPGTACGAASLAVPFQVALTPTPAPPPTPTAIAPPAAPGASGSDAGPGKPGAAAEDGSSGGGLLLVAGAVVLVVAATGGFLLLRRRA